MENLLINCNKSVLSWKYSTSIINAKHKDFSVQDFQV